MGLNRGVAALLVLASGGLFYLALRQSPINQGDTTVSKPNQGTGSDQTRGVRNNNPLNIEYSRANNWQGQTGSDGRFAIFEHSKYGFRAAGKLLQNYQKLYGLHSVNDLINRWAPPNENHTSNYVTFVANHMGVTPNQRLDLTNKSVLTDLTYAMSIMESGHFYSRGDAAQGVNLV